MAAPTDVRVEAESLTTTRVRWTYPGAAAIAIYRSTDGSSYSEITSGARILIGTTEYEDVGLAYGTKYWYKLSDDGGSTFSSVVTVYTHACGTDANGKGTEITLPRETEEQVSAETFNSLATVVEQGLVKFVAPDGRTCVACISGNALVIDCIDFEGCNSIEVAVDQDINSISLPNCADADISINFLVPPNVTRAIGGWPRGIGFTGDEGFRAPVAGGSAGRSINEDIRRGLNINSRSGKSKSSTGTEGTNQGGQSSNTGTCTCTPAADGGLRIVVCNLDGTPNRGNSLGCANSTKGARIIACGGRGPYTWSNTGSITKNATTGQQIVVSPPTNSGSAVAGTAYWVDAWSCGTCSAGTCTAIAIIARGEYDCNDVWVSALVGDPTPCDRVTNCPSTPSPGTFSSCCSGNTVICDGSSPCVDARSAPNGKSFQMCDKRSAPMISGGCNPCGLQAGSTVTVTDADGTQTTVIMRA